MHRQSTVVAALLAWVLFSGCSGEPPAPAEPEPAYRLPFFKRSRLPELQEQFRRLSRRGELPWQLRDRPVPPAENAAPELQKLFAGQQPQQVFQALGDYFPASKLLEDAVRLEQAALQAGRWSQQLAQAQAAMLRPRCVFSIQYEKGLEADLSFVFRVRAVARVAVLQAMQAAAQQNQAAALDHLLLARAGQKRHQALRRCEQLLLRHGLPDVLIDAEYLLDGGTVVFYFLGPPSPGLESLLDHLAREFESQVRLQDFLQAAQQGCGPDCGSEKAAGCRSCAESCALAQMCHAGGGSPLGTQPRTARPGS